MLIKLNSNLVPIFSGTYGTFWDDVTYIDDEGRECEIEFEHADRMKSIIEAYKTIDIKDALQVPFIKKITFTGGFYSPDYYNFSTDTIDFDVVINKKELIKDLKNLKYDDNFSTWLHENFTSIDGFWSHTPNNFDELYAEAIKGNEQSIGAVITYLAKGIDGQDDNNIEHTAYYTWYESGYMGLDYKIIEDEDLK